MYESKLSIYGSATISPKQKLAAIEKNQLQIAVAEQLLFFETDRKCNLKLRVKSISLQFEYN